MLTARYEWQSRGSTHAHYFLWFKDAPKLDFLDDWLHEAVDTLDGGDKGIDVDAVVSCLNDRALRAAQGSCSCNGTCVCDDRARAVAQYWESRAHQLSHAWDDANMRPDNHDDLPHPASVPYNRHISGGDKYSLANLCPGNAPPELCDDVSLCRNRMNRHTACGPYCLRRDAHGTLFCRFKFPVQPREPNVPHFYVEKVKGGVRWRLYLPVNDPLMNMVNTFQTISQRANCDFRPLIDHFSAVEYATKYASKAEKGSKALDKLVSNAMSRAAERADDGDSCRSLFASFLAMQVGGRDWSAQEVGHVQRGHRTVVASHNFVHVSLTRDSAPLRDDLDESTSQHTRVTQPSKFELYLRRSEFLRQHYTAGRNSSQPTLHAYGIGHGAVIDGVDPRVVDRCSFVEFYRHFRIFRGRVRTVERPTVPVVKPRMPSFWGRPGHPKRDLYCRVRLLSFRSFQDQGDLDSYMESFDGDYQAAYEDFALMDPDAPSTCRDDFRHLVFEDEGTEIDSPEQANLHGDFAMFERDPKFDAIAAKATSQKFDWSARTQVRYTAQQIGDAQRWSQMAFVRIEAPSVARIDPTLLNPSQAFIYRVVSAHNESGSEPMRALICGTAGSGKTHLIRALKQLLGDACLVCAPTGVAADNIGGSTYHSKIPVPHSSKGKGSEQQSVRLKHGSKRLRGFVDDFEGVRYLIIDEMSMVGRRALGHIDELLRQVRGSDALFGGISVLLVGDHGQLPPVNDKRCFDWAGCKHVSASKRGEVLAGAPKWQLRGIEAYEQFQDVFFLDRIERIQEEDSSEYFRGLQLRARDGVVEPSDHAYMVSHLHRDGDRIHEFSGPDVKKLVTTHKRRDKINQEHIEVSTLAACCSVCVLPVFHLTFRMCLVCTAYRACTGLWYSDDHTAADSLTIQRRDSHSRRR